MKNLIKRNAIRFILIAMTIFPSSVINSYAGTPEIDQTVSSCNCLRAGYGCFSMQMYCMMYCRWYCSHLHIEAMTGDDAISSDLPKIESRSAVLDLLVDVESNVSIQLIDMTGRIVSTIVQERFEKGEHKIIWEVGNQNGNKIIPGVYNLMVSSGSYTEQQKIVVL
jgi:hypothetical protein